MKKLVIVLMLSLAAVGFVSAQIAATTAAPLEAAMPANPTPQSAVINAYLAGYLTLSNLTSRYDFMLNTAGDTKDVATAKIATNLKNWDLNVKSLKADANNSALVSDTDALRIPYTLKLVGGTNIGTVWASENIVQTTGITKNFTKRVSNGTDGEMITLSIIYGSEASNIDNWSSNMTYTDTLTVTVSAH